MQKVLRRTALAKSQAKRKRRIRDGKETIRDQHLYRIQAQVLQQEKNLAIKQARERRRENWELGPLSPWANPDLSDIKYGTFHARMVNPPTVPKMLRVKDWYIRKGDRVCVVKGREGVKGKIGKVIDCNEETETVTVEDVNMIDIRIPPGLGPAGAGPLHTLEEPIPLSSVTLVYPMPDPTTGIPRDVLVAELRKRNERFDRYKDRIVWDRYLFPQNIKIPWPEEEEEEFVEHDADTPRIKVEEETFLPTLLRPPIPSIIDELRNKYGAFRTRHDDEWVATKIAEDEREQWLKDRTKDALRHGARNIARSPRRDGQKRRDLSDDVLESIGAHMAANGRALQKT